MQPSYVGCYVDANPRVFTNFVDLGLNYPGWNSLYYCQTLAIAANSTFFAMQFGTWCYYGKSASVQLNQYGDVRSDSECNYACAGAFPSSYVPNCGGIWYILALKMF